jgi:hypothetical protein
MRNLIKARIIRVKIDGYPVKVNDNNFHKYTMFISGSLLAISEALPFIDSRGNGIIDTLKKIRDEYNQLK